MKKILLISAFLFFCFSVFLNAQPTIEWEKNYGGSSVEYCGRNKIIEQTKDGGFVIAGSSVSNDKDVSNNKGGSDFWIFKIDSLGNLIWERNYGGNSNDLANCIQQTNDGGFIIAGSTRSNNSGDLSDTLNGRVDVWVIKLNQFGILQWENNYGGMENNVANSIIQSSDGGFIFAGTTNSSTSGNVSGTGKGGYDYWIVKLNALGIIQWEKNVGGNSTYMANSIIQDNMGNYLIAGYTSSSESGDVSGTSNGHRDFWIVKMDTIGNIIWDKVYGGDKNEIAHSIQQCKDGGFILAGETYSSNIGDINGINNGDADFWVMKIDTIGNIEWENNYGGNFTEYGYSIIQSSNGGYVVTGSTFSNASGDVSGTNTGPVARSDFWMVKLNDLGIIEWENNIGGNDEDAAYSILECSDKSYIFAGLSRSNATGHFSNISKGNYDFWIVKLSPDLTSIQNQNLELDLKIYPNPTKNQFTLEILDEKAKGDLQIEITDSKGKILHKQNIQIQAFLRKEFDLSTYQSGVYFIKMQNKAGVLTKNITLTK